MADQDHATTAYNFVPLPAEMLRAEIQPGATDEERKANYIQHVQQTDRLTGFIDIDIQAETPLFIGIGNSEKFFSPTGAPRIPGSTLRGMTKNLVKILTCGAMRGDKDDADFNDKTLFYRAVATKVKDYPDLRPFRDAYREEFTRYENDRRVKGVEAGFLIQTENGRWWIVPTTAEPKRDFSATKHAASIDWPDLSDEDNKNRPITLKCYSGPIDNKRHCTTHVIPDFSTSMRIPLEDAVIQSYQKDTERRGVDLFGTKKVETGKEEKGYTTGAQPLRKEKAATFTKQGDICYVMPCFYTTEDDGSIRHFGFQRNYRVAYHHSIGEHIPDALQSDDIDFADAIFGRKELWHGRVAFEDATAEPDTIRFENAAFPKVLGSPKPAAFQFYLEQKDPERLALWNDKEAHVRGYKFYWHQPKSSWTMDKDASDNMSPHKITPIKKGAIFHGRIRFERLSPVELGALLSVFALGKENPCLRYKIGQGKSIGLGSVSITVNQLKLLDQTKAATLFTADGQWEKGEQDASMDTYTSKFKTYLAKHLTEEGRTSYEALLQELFALMDYDFAKEQKGSWSENDVCTMDIDNDADKEKFSSHRPLPTATEVRQRAEQRKHQDN